MKRDPMSKLRAAASGTAGYGKANKPAKAGPNFTGGASSGVGRLEKISAYGRGSKK